MLFKGAFFAPFLVEAHKLPVILVGSILAVVNIIATLATLQLPETLGELATIDFYLHFIQLGLFKELSLNIISFFKLNALQARIWMMPSEVTIQCTN